MFRENGAVLPWWEFFAAQHVNFTWNHDMFLKRNDPVGVGVAGPSEACRLLDDSLAPWTAWLLAWRQAFSHVVARPLQNASQPLGLNMQSTWSDMEAASRITRRVTPSSASRGPRGQRVECVTRSANASGRRSTLTFKRDPGVQKEARPFRELSPQNKQMKEVGNEP